MQPQDGDCQTLRDAVLKVLDYQSQEATDVRWLSLLCKAALGALHFPVALKERAEELMEYPNKGDMRSVRPFIRACEMSLEMSLPSDNSWGTTFWKECLDNTVCNPAGLPRPSSPEYDQIASIKFIQQVHSGLLGHWFNTLGTTAVDAKHDAVFRFGFYGLAVLIEMIVGRSGLGITGRALLRTLVERARPTAASAAYLNKGLQATGNSVRSYLAPAIPRA